MSTEFQMLITRKLLSSLCLMHYDPSGIFNSVMNGCLKRFLAKACELTPQPDQFETPLCTLDPQFVLDICRFFSENKDLTRIRPVKRAISPVGFVLHQLQTDLDGSLSGGSAMMVAASRPLKQNEKHPSLLTLEKNPEQVSPAQILEEQKEQ